MKWHSLLVKNMQHFEMLHVFLPIMNAVLFTRMLIYILKNFKRSVNHKTLAIHYRHNKIVKKRSH